MNDHELVAAASMAAVAHGHPPLLLQWLRLRRQHGDSLAFLSIGVLFGYDVALVLKKRQQLSAERKLMRGWTYRLVPPSRNASAPPSDETLIKR
jgi:hypothetical protein